MDDPLPVFSRISLVQQSTLDRRQTTPDPGSSLSANPPEPPPRTDHPSVRLSITPALNAIVPRRPYHHCPTRLLVPMTHLPLQSAYGRSPKAQSGQVTRRPSRLRLRAGILEHEAGGKRRSLGAAGSGHEREGRRMHDTKEKRGEEGEGTPCVIAAAPPRVHVRARQWAHGRFHCRLTLTDGRKARAGHEGGCYGISQLGRHGRWSLRGVVN